MPGGVAVGARVGGQADRGGIATRARPYPPLRRNTHRRVTGPDRRLLVDGDADIVPMDLHENRVSEGGWGISA